MRVPIEVLSLPINPSIYRMPSRHPDSTGSVAPLNLSERQGNAVPIMPVIVPVKKLF